MEDMENIAEPYGISYELQEDETGALFISGTFRVEEGEEFRRGDNLHAALVMVVTAPSSFISVNPLRGVVVFEDDLYYSHGAISGAFHVNLTAFIQSLEDKRFNVLFSLGRHLSRIETITLT